MKTTIIRTAQTHPGALSREIAVSLPDVPGIDITHERPETAPRCRVVTPRDRVTPEDFVEIVRREWIKSRGAA